MVATSLTHFSAGLALFLVVFSILVGLNEVVSFSPSLAALPHRLRRKSSLLRSSADADADTDAFTTMNTGGASFSHGEVYNPEGCNCTPLKRPGPDCPMVLIAPPHYIQGPRILPSLGRYVKKLVRGCDSVGLLITAGGQRRLGDAIQTSFEKQGITFRSEIFGGICSYEAVEDSVKSWSVDGKGGSVVGAVVAIGGGSVLDCGKLVAHRLNVPAIAVSTLAATDAPCSALSIMYTEQGGYKGGEVYPLSPSVVIVDTDIVAKAGKRSLVSGFGDALSTYYEARTCSENDDALSMLEARPTVTALAISKLCADILYENAEKAIASVEAKSADDAMEKVVEANTLLSGIGFESGGLAASHAVAQALSWVPSVHDHHMHGEMVAMGLLTMLEMERRQGLPGRKEELDKVLEFLVTVGLPVCHRQAHFDASDDASWDTFLDVCMEQWFCHNEPFEVTKDLIREAFTEVDRLGENMVAKASEGAYLSIHGEVK